MFPFSSPALHGSPRPQKMNSEAGGQQPLCQEAQHQCLEDTMIDGQFSLIRAKGDLIRSNSHLGRRAPSKGATEV